MSTITIEYFARKIGIETERLIQQLNDANIVGKSPEDSLNDEEKRQLLDFLRGATTSTEGAERASNQQKVTNKYEPKPLIEPNITIKGYLVFIFEHWWIIILVIIGLSAGATTLGKWG